MLRYKVRLFVHFQCNTLLGYETIEITTELLACLPKVLHDDWIASCIDLQFWRGDSLDLHTRFDPPIRDLIAL